jgi:hypothetical protein
VYIQVKQASKASRSTRSNSAWPWSASNQIASLQPPIGVAPPFFAKICEDSRREAENTIIAHLTANKEAWTSQNECVLPTIQDIHCLLSIAIRNH